MPQVIVIAAAYGGTAAATAAGYSAAAAAAIGAAAAAVASYGVSEYQTAREERRARDRYNAGLKARLEMVEVNPGQAGHMALGRVRGVDGILRRWTSGVHGEVLTMVVAYACHEIDGFETWWANDEQLTLDINGRVLNAPYLKSSLGAKQVRVVLNAGGVGTYVSATPIEGAYFITSGRYDGAPLTSSLSPDRRTITVNGAPGLTVTINWQQVAEVSCLRIRTWRGTDDQNVGAALAAEYPGQISATDRFAGIALAVIDMIYDPDVYPQGRPNITALMRGARVLDPRTGATAWSENPPLLANAYARSPYGWAVPADEIRTTDITASANVAEVATEFTLRKDDGTTSTVNLPRYRCGIYIDTAASPRESMDRIMTTMAGRWGWAGGTWRMRAGYSAAPVFALDERWIARRMDGGVPATGPVVQLTNGVEREDKVNLISGTCIDPGQRWLPMPFPAVRDPVLIAAHGEYPLAGLELEGVNHPAHAQHLSAIRIRETQAALRMEASCNILAWRCELFDVGAVNLPRYGFDEKFFEVVGWRWHPAQGVQLSTAETAAAIYEPAELRGIDPAPNANLPSIFDVPPLVFLAVESGTAHLLLGADGTIVSRICLRWQAVAAESVRAGGRIEIFYGRADQDVSTWQTVEVNGAATQVYLDPVQDGSQYIITGRCHNGLVGGAWAAHVAHVVLGKADAPSVVEDLAGEAVSGGSVITWRNPADLDYGATRLLIGATLGAAVAIFEGAVNTHTWQYPIAGAYKCWAITLDSSGNPSPPVSADIAVGANTAAGGVEIQYSIDGISLWHPMFADGDLYMRQKVGSGPWSGAIRIVGIKGDKGDAGVDGEGRISARVLIYRRSASGIPSLPSALATLTFSTGVITGLNNGWSIDIPAGSDPCYVSAVTASAVYIGSGTTATIAAVSWAGATLMMSNGAAGLNNATVQVYRRTTTAVAPAGIAGTTTYTFATGLLTGALGAWFQIAPPASDGKYLWTQIATALGTTATDDIPAGEWSAVRLHVQDGETGASQYTLVPRANAVTAGSTAGKVGGANAWDSDVYSVQIYTGAAYAGTRTTSTATHSMFGLSSNPLTALGHDNLNYAIYFEAGTIWVYENGVSRGTFGAYTTASVMSIVYGGNAVRYYRDGVLLLTTAAATGQKLQFKATFHTPGASIDSIAFGPSGPDGLNALQLALSPPAASVLADSSGNVVSGGLAQAVTTAKVTDGQTDVTSLWTISRTNGTGVTSSISGATITVTGMTVDVGEVIVTATRAGYTTQTARLVLTKVRSAAPTSGPVAQLYAYAIGVNASPGSPAIAAVRIETNGQVSVRNGPSAVFTVVAEYYTPPTTNIGSSPGMWVKSTLVSGAATGGTFGTLVKLTAALTFTLTANNSTGGLSSSTKHTFFTDAAGTNAVGVLYADYTADYV